MKDNTRKTGLSTGTIATASSIAAIKVLLGNEPNVKVTDVISPEGIISSVQIKESLKLNEITAQASAIKFDYNDPDITVNHEIISKVKLFDKNSDIPLNKELHSEDIIIVGGDGVGIITKHGLQLPIGSYAINPIPRSMIIKNLKKYLPKNKRALVTITIPEGEELAKKTMNPRLGIIRGLSILGTTGIAISRSNEAYKKSLVYQLSIAMAYKYEELIFVPGNIGEKYALKHFNVNKDQIIQMGNYVGFMLKKAKEYGINKIILLGHIGKLIKIAGGIFNTQNKIADTRREIMSAHTALCGADTETVEKIFNSTTTEEMLAILRKKDMDKAVLKNINKSIVDICKERFNIDIELILIDMKGNKLN
ncbi:cobalt-precorrin-5B (C(1))-methyltransferase CbiD [Methanobrevibacter filiformis]|uniref:Cobalt-precorrin-5B C(1)-methyltransferase n=1 Tax=Methanobrevibacter filiformis TaxID=55758 RepID=A0A166CKD1_9EURY|nr:cobalt-precorrin-5B (C(1))-methyltransferase CbiD [Methanobrevibacter filiformis]KZX14601.1 cobalt-precorrin-6A synthase [Methanobrevibacter filiformis]